MSTTHRQVGKLVHAVLLVYGAVALYGQNLDTLYSFCANSPCKDGYGPWPGLVQGTDGNFYGVASQGGAFNIYGGTIFKLSPSGEFTTLYSFCSQSGCTDGSDPFSALVEAGGLFYGTTNSGGLYNLGTVFKVTPGGQLTTLYNFCSQPGCADGANPHASLTLAANGDLYGTTSSSGPNGGGTVYKITPSGALATLYSFCAQSDCTDGKRPTTGLVLAPNGNFYGTTFAGGTNGNGTVFKITTDGVLTTLYSFCTAPGCSDGSSPVGGLVQAVDGNFYGTTEKGGAGGASEFHGTVFKITASGTLTTVARFCAEDNCSAGARPTATLTVGSDGNLYGTALKGGNGTGDGSIFEMSPGGAPIALHSFCTAALCPDGRGAYSGLIQSTDGDFYGTTLAGGVYINSPCEDGACGNIYRLSTGLSPFVKTQPSFGKVGAAIEILGNHLAEASSVTFDGVAATFSVNSSRVITARIPTGAGTGKVQVTTSDGTLISNLDFRVIQ